MSKPILFNGEMVKAILDGRKTQTRRVIKVQPPGDDYVFSTILDTTGDQKKVGKHNWYNDNSKPDSKYFSNPYGLPGDKLWVRETWRETTDQPGVMYRADGWEDCIAQYNLKWRPSIHMPRWASRITLEITGVRVDRVQDIKPIDCVAEGIYEPKYNYKRYEGMMATIAFEKVWNSINAKRGFGWDTNPWVWVIEFMEASDE